MLPPVYLTIEFQTPSTSLVSLDVYNLMGAKITTLLNKVLPSGLHTIDFEKGSLPEGVYFYKLTLGNYSIMRKMLLIK